MVPITRSLSWPDGSTFPQISRKVLLDGRFSSLQKSGVDSGGDSKSYEYASIPAWRKTWVVGSRWFAGSIKRGD